MKLYCERERFSYGSFDTDSVDEALKLAGYTVDEEGYVIDDYGTNLDVYADELRMIPDHPWKVYYSDGKEWNEKFFDDFGEAYNFAHELSQEWEEKGIFDADADANIDIVDQYANDYRGKILEWW